MNQLRNQIYSTPENKSSTAALLEARGIANRIRARQRHQYRQELKRLSRIGRTLLIASDGNAAEASSMLDDLIDLLFEDGTLQQWRYRLLLARIKEGRAPCR